MSKPMSSNRCQAKDPTELRNPSICLNKCRRKAGHEGPHRSTTHQWEDGDNMSDPRFEHYRSPIA